MRKPIRRALFAGVALVAVAFIASQQLGSAQAYEQPADEAQPQTMEQFLTTVTKDVDAYWTSVFEDSGLPEPRVSYAWIPAGGPPPARATARRHHGRQRRRLLLG